MIAAGSEGKNKAYLYYYVLAFLLLILILPLKTKLHDTNLPPLNGQVRLATTLLAANLFIAYFLLARFASSIRLTADTVSAMAAGVLLFCSAPIFFTADVLLCLMYGRMATVYHHSNYGLVPNDIPQDLLFPFASPAWRDTPDVYGPLHAYFEMIPSYLFPNSVQAELFVIKLIYFLFFLIGVYFFAKLTKKIFPSGWKKALVLFAFNPWVIFLAIGDGKNDVMMMALSVVSVYFLLEDKYSRAFIFWTLAFMTKYSVAILLPFLIAEAARRLWLKKRLNALFFIKEPLINLAILFIFFAPLWVGEKNIYWLQWASHQPIYSNTLLFLVKAGCARIGLGVNDWLLRNGALFLYGLFYAGLIIRLWRDKSTDDLNVVRSMSLLYIGFYLITTQPLQGTYLAWGLPWVVLAGWPLGSLPVLLYSLVGFFHIFKRINFLILIAAAVYAAALFFSARRSRPKSA